MRIVKITMIILFLAVFLSGCISSLALPVVAGVVTNLPKPEPPTSSGLSITVYPNPVPFSIEDNGWAYTIKIENPSEQTIYISQLEIKGIMKFSIVSFPIPEEVLDAQEIAEKFGSHEIPPGGSISWKKIYTRDNIKDMIKKYDSYPGVNITNAIYGLNINIKAKGYNAESDYIEGTTGTITFTNSEE